MYYSDKPIERISEDKLDRKGFAKTIAKILFDLKQTDTFTLGLLGKWGVGKTSLVNLILSEFYDLMKKELLDDVNVVKFILYFVGQWEGDDISYEIRTPIDYLSNEQVLSSISNLRQDKRLFSLDKEYQYGAGAFFIAIKNNGRISEHIPQKEIVQLLSEWRN